MAMKARYTVIDGEIIAEKRSGVRRLYVPNSLGSTVALLDNTQTQTDTFDYWPYGEVRARTGTTPTPFKFVGTWGYYGDSSGRGYVRARHLDPTKGRWLGPEPLWPSGGDVNRYAYAGGSPVTATDASGLQPRADPRRAAPRKRRSGAPYLPAIGAAVAGGTAVVRPLVCPRPVPIIRPLAGVLASPLTLGVALFLLATENAGERGVARNCEYYEQRGFGGRDYAEALKGRFGNVKLPGRSTEVPATACEGGKHYGVRIGGNYRSVLCCPCLDLGGWEVWICGVDINLGG